MAYHIKNITQDHFDMSRYGVSKHENHCDTVGCIIGHCISLDEGNIPLTHDGLMSLDLWVEQFTGIKVRNDDHTYTTHYQWLFGYDWARVDNTPLGAYNRIIHTISNGIPDNWRDQMNGIANLSYRTPTPNIENLNSMAEYIKNVPQKVFSMHTYRDFMDGDTPHCNSVGCIIGHCVILDNPLDIPRDWTGDISFLDWSTRFTGIHHSSVDWDYMFSGKWVYIDNTPIGASERIKNYINKGVPMEFLINNFAKDE